MKSIYQRIEEEISQKQGLVLATVTRTEGSTPQKPGSSAIFSDKGLISGTIGGGVVEGRVQIFAVDALKSGQSSHLNFNLNNDISKTSEAICGGKITVLLDADPSKSISVFRQLSESLKNRVPGVLITMVTIHDDTSVLINRYWMSNKSIPRLPEEFLEKISPVVTEQLTKGSIYDFREMTLSISGEEPSSLFLLEPVFPPEQLVIAGAGHIGRALAHLGNLLGFEVTVIDDRSEYANKENIPDADHVIVKDIGHAMHEIKKGADTYVVIVTRGHKDDAEALKPCIGASLAYTGMIGSIRKVATMKQEFIEKKIATKEDWDKIYAPVGIDIGSQTVEEIAVSIAAQLVQVRNGRLK
ncbi:MAG: XdhC family protein [Bacteroidetes bacterium]|nr:XdhC family protein [Bacteroidota bacterium]